MTLMRNALDRLQCPLEAGARHSIEQLLCESTAGKPNPEDSDRDNPVAPGAL